MTEPRLQPVTTGHQAKVHAGYVGLHGDAPAVVTLACSGRKTFGYAVAEPVDPERICGHCLTFTPLDRPFWRIERVDFDA
jgi:hypothetical protein